MEKGINRTILFAFCCIVMTAAILLIVFIVSSIFVSDTVITESSEVVLTQSSEESDSEHDTESQSETIIDSTNDLGLDTKFGNLLLVNADNPLPDTYDSDVRASLVEFDPQYRNNNNVTQIHKDIYPYITAMVAAAQKDGVDLRVWSPFRSYAIQKDLFQKQVNRVGGDEAKAATVVARPGTSEHNTGLCADFNMASDAFENTEMYTWMLENAEDYGFVLRYREDKQPITGVIHESWHWRFVGINNAIEMNKLDMCLEEYVEYLEKRK